jgi:hypothetical protein
MYSRFAYAHIVSAAHALFQVLRKVLECKQVRSSLQYCDLACCSSSQHSFSYHQLSGR